MGIIVMEFKAYGGGAAKVPGMGDRLSPGAAGADRTDQVVPVSRVKMTRKDLAPAVVSIVAPQT